MSPRPTIELNEEACNLVSAALRHLRDADTLLHAKEGRSSPDGAYYLAGFAPELVGKATLAERWLDRAIGHVDCYFGGRGLQALSLAHDLDPIAYRYSRLDVGAYPFLQKWSTNVRYDRTDSIAISDANTLLSEASRITDDIILSMWADGRFPARSRVW